MRSRRRETLLAGAALMAQGWTAWPLRAQGGATLDGRTDAVEQALRQPVERGDFPGVVAAVTTPESTIYEAAFGERALGGGVPMTVDTVFNIASMTKAITAACAMQLVEQGKLDLDAPIQTYVPDAAKLRVADGWDSDGQPRLRPPKRDITLRMLNTHTAGFVYNQWDADFDRFVKATKFPALNSGDERAWYPPLMFDPGERWEYGISIDWIGRLVEVTTGKSLGTYMQDNFFAPLGMTSTGYRISPDMEKRRVTIHQRGDDGRLTTTETVTKQDPPFEGGGGGLYSTVGDYQRFVRMILNKGRGNGQQLLKPETVAEMSRNQMGDVRVVMLKTTNPARSLDAEFFPGLPKSWSLSFMINEEEAPTGRPAGSLAWAGLYNTFFWIDPRNEIGGVWMSQLLPFVDTATVNAFYDFEAAVYKSMG